MALDLTAFDAVLKDYYTDQRVKHRGYRHAPLLAMMPKMESFRGRRLPIPIWYGQGQGRGVTVAQAQTNKSDGYFEDFFLTRSKNYSTHDIDNETMKASRGDAAAFLSGRTALMDQAVNVISRDAALDLYKSGAGERGRLSAVAATNFTLGTTEDVVNIEVGMRIVFADGLTSGATISAPTGGSYYLVSAVDRINGIVSVTEPDGTPADLTAGAGAVVANDYVFVAGDCPAETVAGASTVRKIVGLAGWLPTAVVSPGDDLFGVDRSVDSRLQGLIYDAATPGDSVEEAVINAGTLCFREGAAPDYVFMNPVHRAEIVKSLQGKADYEPVTSSDGKIGFRALVIESGAGPVKVIADPNCPLGKAYMLQMNTWKLCSLYGVPHLLDEDGMTIQRKPTDDAYEVRFGYYAQLGCHAPAYNCVISLPTS